MSGPSPLADREAYEAQVRALADVAKALLTDGLDEESVARILVDRRNRLKLRFRQGLDQETLAWIEARNEARYGSPLGPTAEEQFARYGSWRGVIAAASRLARLSKGR